MARIFYVNSEIGDDSNSGRSPDAALASIEAVEKLHLSPGDQVLFARGTGYSGQLDLKYSGTTSAHIVYGAYGDGEPPQFYGASQAIFATKIHHVVVQDIAISGTSKNAIYAQGVNEFTISNVTVDGQGPHGSTVGLSIQASQNVTIKGSTIANVTGDGIWIDNLRNINIENNTIRTANGHAADAIQVENSVRVRIAGNELDMTDAHSSKGNLVVNHSQDVLIEANTMIGGGFGASINSDDVAIVGNEIYGQKGYSWTFGIGLGEAWDVSNYLVSENYIHDVRYGVALTGTNDTAQRTNVDVIGNIFADISGAALKVDRPSTGEFSDNVIAPGSRHTQISSAGSDYTIGLNRSFINVDPTANPDYGTVAPSEDDLRGNMLANDVSEMGANLVIDSIDYQAVTEAVTVQGQYGALTVARDGSYRYVVDSEIVSLLDETVTDRFTYTVTDGQNKSLAQLVISIDPRPNDAPIAVNDLPSTFGGHAGTNILGNDQDADGNALSVQSFNGVALGEHGAVTSGTFGSVKVLADGSFWYDVDTKKLDKINFGNAFETFKYSVSDGRESAEGIVSISLAELVGDKIRVKPTTTSDRNAVDAEGYATGNVLSNDYHAGGGSFFVTSLGSQLFAKGSSSMVVQGEYGLIRINKNGNYTYDMRDDVAGSTDHKVYDTFLYKVHDGTFSNAAYLTIAIDPLELNV